MSLKFYSLVIKDIVKDTRDSVIITFDVPPHLQETFTYKQGQNITLCATINGEQERRSYSICSAPADGRLRVGIKRIDGGVFSTYANKKLKVGDVLEVMPPVGKFYTELNPSHQKNYLAIAAGSGITPMVGIIKQTLITEPLSTVTLIYGNRSRGTIMFFEELEALKNQYITRLNLVNVLSREKTEADLLHGRIDAQKLEALARVVDYSTINEAFICGPVEMIFAASDFLQANGLAKEHIHFELFTSPNEGKKKDPLRVITDDTPKADVLLKLDGRSLEFKLAFDHASILDAALSQGADLPYACKGGVCCTCKAKLIEGEVQMDVTYGLEPDELAHGYILTCQAKPITDKVVIDFDLR
jgi:ring-1,2-phenylacetyl-CoA epoxidase subunit PaaE